MLLAVLLTRCRGTGDALGAAADDTPTLPDTLAWWPLNEAEGQVVHEVSGHGLDGYRGALDTPDEADPRLHTTQGMVFDGAAHVTVPVRNRLSWGDTFTLELEFRLDRQMPERQRCDLLNKGHDVGARSWNVSIVRRGKTSRVGFKYKAKDNTRAPGVSSNEVLLDLYRWHHLAMVRANGLVTIYLNGRPVGNGPAPTTPAPNAHPLRIGCYASGAHGLRGSIRNVGIRTIAAVPVPSPPAPPSVLPESCAFEGPRAAAWQPDSESWEFADGEARNFSDETTEQGEWLALSGRWRDLSFEFDARTEDGLGEVMAAFRRRDVNNTYRVRYTIGSGLSKLAIEKLVGARLTVLAQRVDGLPELRRNGPPVRLRIDCYGELIAVSSNREQLLLARDADLASGGVALGMNSRKVAFSSPRLFRDAAVSLKMQAEEPLILTITQADFRHAFRRGEEIRLEVAVRNTTTEPTKELRLDLTVNRDTGFQKQLRLPATDASSTAHGAVDLETAHWKAGEYRLTARLSTTGFDTVTGDYAISIVRRPLPDQFRYYNWGDALNVASMRDLRAHGLNGMTFSVEPNADFSADKDHYAKYFDEALRLEMHLGVHLPTNYRIPRGRPETRVVLPNGKYGRSPNPMHPAHQAFSRAAAKRLVETFAAFPALDNVLLTSENENMLGPSCSPADRARVRRDLGLDIPDFVVADAIKDGVKSVRFAAPPAVCERAPPVFPDRHPYYVFYHWLWAEGFGDNVMNEELARIIHRARPDVVTHHDPFRDVPIFGRNRGLDMAGTWFYIHPHAGEALIMSEILIAAAEPEKQKVGYCPSLWLYASRICPAKQRQAGVQPGDLIREAVWIGLSRRVDKLEHFGIRFIRPGNNCEYQQPQLYDQLAELSRTVLRPLWPALMQMKRPRKPCALLLSAGSQLFGRRTWGGYGNSEAGAWYTALQMAHIPTSVVFEENILRGDLEQIKILFLPGITHLPQSVFDRIVVFASQGSVVVLDGPLADEIPGAMKYAPDLSRYMGNNYYKVNRKGADARGDKMEAGMERCAAEMRERFGALAPIFASSPSDRVFLNTLECGDARYLFVVNDHRTFGDYVGKKHRIVMEQGLRQKTTIRLNATDVVLYDVLASKALATRPDAGGLTFDLELPAAGGKLVAIYPKPIQDVSLSVPERARRRATLVIGVTVAAADGEAQCGSQPIHVQLCDPSGQPGEISGWYATRDGQLCVPFSPAVNDLPGTWRLLVREQSSGKTAAAQFLLE